MSQALLEEDEDDGEARRVSRKGTGERRCAHRLEDEEAEEEEDEEDATSSAGTSLGVGRIYRAARTQKLFFL